MMELDTTRIIWRANTNMKTIHEIIAALLIVALLAIAITRGQELSPVPAPVAAKPTLAEVREFITKQRKELRDMGKAVEGDKKALQLLHAHVQFYVDELPKKP